MFVEAIDGFESLVSPTPTSKDNAHILAIAYNNLAENLRFMMKSGHHSPPNPKYNFAAIIKLYGRAEQVWDQWKDSKDDEVDYWRGTLYNNMGLYNMESVRHFPNALVHFLKASEIRKALLDRMTSENYKSEAQIDLVELRSHLAVTFNNIGQCYVNMRQTKQAMPYFDSAKYLFDQYRSLHATESLDRIYVVVLNNIGLTYFELNRYDEALKHFRKALGILSHNEEEFASVEAGANENTETTTADSAATETPVVVVVPPEKHLTVEELDGLIEQGCGEELGITLNNIGTVYYMKGKFQLCEDYLRLALHLFAKVLAPNHKHIATTSTQLALALREKHSKSPQPSKEMLKSNASAILSKMGWNPFKNASQGAELTQEQKDHNESKALLEKAKTIATIHQTELASLQKGQQQKEQNTKKFQGKSFFSQFVSNKRPRNK